MIIRWRRRRTILRHHHTLLLRRRCLLRSPRGGRWFGVVLARSARGHGPFALRRLGYRNKTCLTAEHSEIVLYGLVIGGSSRIGGRGEEAWFTSLKFVIDNVGFGAQFEEYRLAKFIRPRCLRQARTKKTYQSSSGTTSFLCTLKHIAGDIQLLE